MMQKRITVSEGFRAIEKFLEKWYGFTKSDDIAFVLSGMGMDPAFWQDWVESVKAIYKETGEKNLNHNGCMKNKLTVLEAFQAMTKFLDKYYNFIKSDDLGSLLGSMQLLEDNSGTWDPAVWNDWVESVEEVLKKDRNIN